MRPAALYKELLCSIPGSMKKSLFPLQYSLRSSTEREEPNVKAPRLSSREGKDIFDEVNLVTFGSLICIFLSVGNLFPIHIICVRKMILSPWGSVEFYRLSLLDTIIFAWCCSSSASCQLFLLGFWLYSFFLRYYDPLSYFLVVLRVFRGNKIFSFFCPF